MNDKAARAPTDDKRLFSRAESERETVREKEIKIRPRACTTSQPKQNLALPTFRFIYTYLYICISYVFFFVVLFNAAMFDKPRDRGSTPRGPEPYDTYTRVDIAESRINGPTLSGAPPSRTKIKANTCVCACACVHVLTRVYAISACDLPNRPINIHLLMNEIHPRSARTSALLKVIYTRGLRVRDSYRRGSGNALAHTYTHTRAIYLIRRDIFCWILVSGCYQRLLFTRRCPARNMSYIS